MRMNSMKRLFKKASAIGTATIMALSIGLAIAHVSSAASSCVSLPNGPFDGPGNSVIGNGAPNIATIQHAYNSDVTVRDIYNHFGISQNDVDNLCTTAVAGTIYKNGDVYVGNTKVATGAITAGRQNISGSTSVTVNGFTFYVRPPSVSFASNSIQAYIVMQNGQFKFGIMNACGNPFTAHPTPPNKGALACQILSPIVDSTAKNGDVTYTFQANATASHATITSYVFNFGVDANGKQVAAPQTMTTSAQKVTSQSVTYLAGSSYKNIFVTIYATAVTGAKLTAGGQNSSCSTNVNIPPQTCATGSTAKECQPTCTSPTNGQTYPVGSPQCQPVTPPTPPSQPLPNTGAGNIFGLFAGTSVLGTLAHRFIAKRRQFGL